MQQLNPKNAFECYYDFENSSTYCVSKDSFDIKIFRYSSAKTALLTLSMKLFHCLTTISNAFSGSKKTKGGKGYIYSRLIIMPLLLYTLFLLKGVSPTIAYADYPDMDMSASPNPVGSGARAMGMGGAFIGVADDATAASWNPAGLLQLLKPEVSVVGSFLSRSTDYEKLESTSGIQDDSPDIYHINYLSAAVPFQLFRRNVVFSLNYQHLYEFSLNSFSVWSEPYPDSMIDVIHMDKKCQKGSLGTLSPALGIQITPLFSIGITCNLWDDALLKNGWENINVQEAEGVDLGSMKDTHNEIYERYDFSGFNIHLGFLFKSDYFSIWGGKRKLRVGGVLKTPFDADIRHEKRTIFYERYYENPVLNNFRESASTQNLTLKMPLSYGIGAAFDFSDSLCLSLDIYRTHWDQYLVVYPSGKRWSPINKKQAYEAGIKATTQLRMGIEYLFHNPGRIIPVRLGLFFDPEPAEGRIDNIYGISLGTGISYMERFSFDCAYQVRSGNKREDESIEGKNISGRLLQHYLYASIIYYLF